MNAAVWLTSRPMPHDLSAFAHQFFIEREPVQHPDVHHRVAQRLLNAAPPPQGYVRLPRDPLSAHPLWDGLTHFFHRRSVDLAEFASHYADRS